MRDYGINQEGDGMRKVELDYAPLRILQNHKIECEMTDSQLAFLCGILKSRKPKKVVEVGVAHGGTTCIILQCLKESGVLAELHSVDITEECYRVHGKRTGYAVDTVFEQLPENITHYWHLGNVLPTYLEEIGDGIDFLILDTVHSMPGEMLDFLAALPYLASNAVVILHDITLNQISTNVFCYATRIVYDVAVTKKIIADDVDPDEILPGIGAFEITEDTFKYIERCFSALVITWSYDIPDKELEQYEKIYKKFYEDSLVDLFRRAVAINRKRMLEEKVRKEQSQKAMIAFHECVMKECRIILYGGGYWADLISQYLHTMGRKVDAYVVSDDIDLNTCRIRENIFHYSDLPYVQNECGLILAVDSDKQKIVMSYLAGNSFQYVFSGEGFIYDRLALYIDDIVTLYKAK